MNGVREVWSSQEKEQHQHRGKADASQERGKRVKGSYTSVHVAVDESRSDQDSDL